MRASLQTPIALSIMMHHLDSTFVPLTVADHDARALQMPMGIVRLTSLTCGMLLVRCRPFRALQRPACALLYVSRPDDSPLTTIT